MRTKINTIMCDNEERCKREGAIERSEVQLKWFILTKSGKTLVFQPSTSLKKSPITAERGGKVHHKYNLWSNMHNEDLSLSSWRSDIMQQRAEIRFTSKQKCSVCVCVYLQCYCISLWFFTVLFEFCFHLRLHIHCILIGVCILKSWTRFSQ